MNIKTLFLLSCFCLLLSGCVIQRKRDFEWKMNAIYMIGRMEQMSHVPYCGFRKIKLTYNFPYWDTEFNECHESEKRQLREK